MNSEQRDALLTLGLTPGLGPTLTRRCLDALGSARAVVEADVNTLTTIEGIGKTRARSIRQNLDELADGKQLELEKQLIDEHGAAVLTISDDNYPRLLRHIPDPPPILYMRGQMLPQDAVALAIVGSRRCSQYGREQADRLSALCSQAGLCIVSGGAYGIDAAAHRAVLRVKGRTIAVLGSGLARPYPDAHIDLFDQIVKDDRGAVISELPMQSPPAAENFPRRNRLISGLALGVLVVEAANRSGALITARLAVEEHSREVMALPGRVDSKASEGCHKMIRQGWATLVTSAPDILDALGEAGQILKADMADTPDQQAPVSHLLEQNLTESQRRIIHTLDQPCSLDQLVGQSQLAASVVQADLTMLQIRGMVTRQSGLYVRKT